MNAKNIIRMASAIVMAVALTVLSTPANAGSCERKCNTSSVTEDELQTCLKKCGGGNVVSTDTGKKHRGGGNVAKAVLRWCPSANDGAGGELTLKQGEACPACPEGSQPSKDDRFCEKSCGPAFGQMMPVAGFDKNCPSCESRDMKVAKDGSCFKEQVIAASSTPTCTDCNTCNHFCWSWWDLILLAFILVLTIVFRTVMNKESVRLLKEFDGRGKKLLEEVRNLLGNTTASKAELDKLISKTDVEEMLTAAKFFTRAKLSEALRLNRLIDKQERKLEASRQGLKRLEADSIELDKGEAELNKLEDAATKAATELAELETAKAALMDKFMSIDMTNASAVASFNADKLELLGKLETAKAKTKAACESRDSALKAHKAECDNLADQIKSETKKAEQTETELAALNTELETGAPPLPRT